MTDLSALDDLIEGQDRGAEMVVRHPVTDQPMDIVLTIAGPDSDTARRARLKFDDEMLAFRSRPPADELDRKYIDRLARCVIGWRVTRDGKPFEFSFTNVRRLLNDMPFVREQVDKFAASRVPYFLRTL